MYRSLFVIKNPPVDKPLHQYTQADWDKFKAKDILQARALESLSKTDKAIENDSESIPETSSYSNG